NGNIGIRGVELREREGSLVGIMGSSGAGKTTLLNILSGLENPTSGEVIINGINLHGKSKQIEGVIGFVPQDDLLFEELTVSQNLYYNAKLCFKELGEKELVQLVLKVLANLGLQHIKDLRVGNTMNKTISGGQRKRLNIGLELLREPSIMFLDEPTSGLSSKDSENILDLLRELAFRGKLIFVVIHQPSSDIFKMFDKIVLLDTGGYQVYYGNPIDAVSYFKRLDNQINSEAGECVLCGAVNPETIFNVIESKEIDEYGNHSQHRKIKPQRWEELFRENIEINTIETVSTPPPKSLNSRNKLQQFGIFFSRDFLSKISNKQYLLLNLLEAPVLAFFLAFIVRYSGTSDAGEYTFKGNDNIAAYVFMSIVVAMFIGLTVSAEEIFRDRLIRKREEFLKLSRLSDLLSKCALLFLLSAIQSLTFVLIGDLVLEIEGMNLAYWAMLFTISCLANILGLIISSSFNSAVTIYIIIPLLIIPQMILGGAMFNYDKLNHFIGGGIEKNVPFIADLMPTRWGYEALIVDTYVNNHYGIAYYDIERKESLYSFKQSFYIPKLEEILYECRAILHLDNASSKEDYNNLLETVQHEIILENNSNAAIQFNAPQRINANEFDDELYHEIKQYLTELDEIYMTSYNGVAAKKELLTKSLKAKDSASYHNLRADYYNENLNELLTNSLAKDKIVLTKENTFKRKADPVYLYPDKGGFIDLRTHFYAPKKHLLGSLIDTYWFNLIVLWCYSFLLFIILYFNLLSRLMSIGNLFKSKQLK
ncbi:MAG: ATP-binding cassette domain-containing protein, partial [Flavobacteriales bacterium]|nr:ATP-binding cassette domain-containing protein [Flavobacteriales bacterium]